MMMSMETNMKMSITMNMGNMETNMVTMETKETMETNTETKTGADYKMMILKNSLILTTMIDLSVLKIDCP